MTRLQVVRKVRDGALGSCGARRRLDGHHGRHEGEGAEPGGGGLARRRGRGLHRRVCRAPDHTPLRLRPLVSILQLPPWSSRKAADRGVRQFGELKPASRGMAQHERRGPHCHVPTDILRATRVTRPPSLSRAFSRNLFLPSIHTAFKLISTAKIAVLFDRQRASSGCHEALLARVHMCRHTNLGPFLSRLLSARPVLHDLTTLRVPRAPLVPAAEPASFVTHALVVRVAS